MSIQRDLPSSNRTKTKTSMYGLGTGCPWNTSDARTVNGFMENGNNMLSVEVLVVFDFSNRSMGFRGTKRCPMMWCFNLSTIIVIYDTFNVNSTYTYSCIDIWWTHIILKPERICRGDKTTLEIVRRITWSNKHARKTYNVRTLFVCVRCWHNRDFFLRIQCVFV